MERDAERAAHVAARAAQVRLAAKLRAIAAQANTTRANGFRVPVVDSDPAANFPTNLWGFDDGRIRWRGSDGTIHELWPGFAVLSLSSAPAASSGIDYYRNSGDDSFRVRRPDGSWAIYPSQNPTAGGDSMQGGSNTTKPKQPDTSPTKKRQTWSSTWSRTLCVSHGVEEANRDEHYGHFPGSAHGMRRVMIGFNDSAIRSALAGADIKKVEIHALNVDSWNHSGVDLHWGAHNRSAAPSTFSAVRRNAFIDHWPEAGDGAYWRTAPDWFGRAFRDNGIKGLTIDQPDGASSYGQIRGGSVKIRITYTS